MGAIPGITGTGGEVAARASQPHRPGSGVLVGAPGCAQTPRWGGENPPKSRFVDFFPLAEVFISPTTGMVLLGTWNSTGTSCQPASNLGNFWHTNMAKAVCVCLV